MSPSHRSARAPRTARTTVRAAAAALAFAVLAAATVVVGGAAQADTVSPATTADAVRATTASATSTGTWLSGASGTGSSDGTFGTWRGRGVDIVGTWSGDNANAANFWQFQKGFALAGWTGPVDVAVGAIDAGETWAAAATGAYDARWTASLKKLASLRQGDGTTYIRLAHEMNGNWYPWAVTSTNYTSFDTAWKRYRALQLQYFPSAKLVFSLNRESIGTGMDWRTFFPGSAYVDVLSVDYYNQYPYVATDQQWTASLDDVDQWGAPKGLGRYLAYAKSQGLPLAISEWSGKASNGDSAPWITDFLDYVRDHAGSGAGQILYEIVFNVSGYNGDFQLHGSDARMPLSAAAYRGFYASESAKTAAAAAAQTAADTKAATQAAAAAAATAAAEASAAYQAATKASAAAAAKSTRAQAAYAKAQKAYRAAHARYATVFRNPHYALSVRVAYKKAAAKTHSAAITARSAGTAASSAASVAHTKALAARSAYSAAVAVSTKTAATLAALP